MKSFLRKNNTLTLIFIYLIIANFATLFVNPIGWSITLSFFLLIPGFLTLKLIKQSSIKGWELVFLSICTSILLLILVGLIINSLQFVGFERPLNKVTILSALDIMSIALIYLNKVNLRNIDLIRNKNSFSKEEIAVLCFGISLPIVASFGAIRLNNGSDNLVALILLALVFILFMWLVVRPSLKRMHVPVLYFIGLAVLLSISLRGWGISGHDIQREFAVFNLAIQNQVWDISAYRDPYNACLSITLLPAMLFELTKMAPEFIFKIVFQILTAIIIIPVYLLAKRVKNPSFALAATFMFIAFPVFLNDLPMLNRQEIGLLFFAAMILAIFLQVKQKIKYAFILLSLLGLVLSHYSSSYIAIGLFVLSLIILRLLFKFFNKKKQIDSGLPAVSPRIIIIALLVAFLWNTQITNTSRGLNQTINGTITSLLDRSSTQSWDVAYNIFGGDKKSPEDILKDYAGENASEVIYKESYELPASSWGNALSAIIDPATFNGIMRNASAKLLQLLLFIGLFVMLFRIKKLKEKTDSVTYYVFALSASCTVLLLLQTVLPQLSVNYGTLRFFQQLLIITAVPITIGIYFIFKFLSLRKQRIMVGVFAGFMFLNLSGFIPQILGSYPPQFALNNSGIQYESYYIHTSEVMSKEWLMKQKKASQPLSIQMDSYALLRFQDEIMKSEVRVLKFWESRPNDYLYEDYANVVIGSYQASAEGNHINYSLRDKPSSSMNLIYNNTQSKVYK